MPSPLDALPSELRDRLKETPQPDWTSPMLATLVDSPFSDPGWIFERKLDGERVLGFKKGSTRLFSRNRKELNGNYPELVDALDEQQAREFVVDGEVVAFDGATTSFSRLQPRMQSRDPDKARRSGVAVYYYVFDVLYLDGYDVTGLPLRARKSVLRKALTFRDPLRFTIHRNTDGEAFLQDACRKGWEGLIGKRADATYVHSRSRDWLKLKCVNEQEFVIGGYTEPAGKRTDFGALLIGYYDGGRLRYAGKVGTGYDAQTLERLGRLLRSRERRTTPFDDGGLPRKGVHWVSPELVCQVGFTEWTGDGKLRHPRFQGLRRDKDASKVVREVPS